jgi:hypothetical protein
VVIYYDETITPTLLIHGLRFYNDNYLHKFEIVDYGINHSEMKLAVRPAYGNIPRVQTQEDIDKIMKERRKSEQELCQKIKLCCCILLTLFLCANIVGVIVVLILTSR